MKWTFDNDGLLSAVTDTHGLARTYVYDAAHRLTEVHAVDGGVATLHYATAAGSQHLLDSVSEPGGRVLTVNHLDALSAETNLLTGLQDADGFGRTFSYDSHARLTEDAWAPFDAHFSYSAGLLSATDYARLRDAEGAMLADAAAALGFSPPSAERWLDGLASTLDRRGTLVIADIHRESRGMRRRRAEKPLLPVREMNARTRDEVRAMLERRGFAFERGCGYQLTWPVPQLMHLLPTRAGASPSSVNQPSAPSAGVRVLLIGPRP